MQNKSLFLKYNKVTNESFDNLSNQLDSHTIADLSIFGKNIDILSYDQVDKFLTPLLPFSTIFIGDIFWPTGQNICKWCISHSVSSCFIQHGQWIYVKNKMNPRHLPSLTCVYGDNIANMVNSWPYGHKSKVVSTGNPRYDNIEINDNRHDCIYFCPPVMKEIVPSGPDRMDENSVIAVKSLIGIDRIAKLSIHPHYREGWVDYLHEWFPEAVFIDQSENALTHIQQSDLVITHRNSTSVLDAIACGKKAILINFNNIITSFFNNGYFKDFAVECDNAQSCLKYCSKYQVGHIANSYIEDAKPYLYLGDASKRIAEMV